MAQDLSQYSVQQLWNLYNAIMANAWPGDEHTVMQELSRRGAV